MAEQRRHVSYVGDDGNWTYAVQVRMWLDPAFAFTTRLRGQCTLFNLSSFFGHYLVFELSFCSIFKQKWPKASCPQRETEQTVGQWGLQSVLLCNHRDKGAVPLHDQIKSLCHWYKIMPLKCVAHRWSSDEQLKKLLQFNMKWPIHDPASKSIQLLIVLGFGLNLWIYPWRH
jgi:hypothetical protein